jgi:hypothetical protein
MMVAKVVELWGKNKEIISAVYLTAALMIHANGYYLKQTDDV